MKLLVIAISTQLRYLVALNDKIKLEERFLETMTAYIL